MAMVERARRSGRRWCRDGDEGRSTGMEPTTQIGDEEASLGGHLLVVLRAPCRRIGAERALSKARWISRAGCNGYPPSTTFVPHGARAAAR